MTDHPSIDLVFLDRFTRESNRIEGIFNEGLSLGSDIDALNDFLGEDLGLDRLGAVKRYAHSVTRGKGIIRNMPGMDVSVGGYAARLGGIEIETRLAKLLEDYRHGHKSPFQMHREFERLHPFMDGNGRTGRALWLWQLIWRPKYGRDLDRVHALGFLHTYYYQSLEDGR